MESIPYLEAFFEHKYILELSQGILIELIKAIYVHKNGEIQFKFENQYKRIVEFIENNKYTLTVVENVG